LARLPRGFGWLEAEAEPLACHLVSRRGTAREPDGIDNLIGVRVSGSANQPWMVFRMDWIAVPAGT